MSSLKITGDDWVNSTVRDIRRNEERKRLHEENVALTDRLIEQNARSRFEQLIPIVKNAVELFNIGFSDQPKKRFSFSLSDADTIIVANECYGVPRVKATFDERHQMMTLAFEWADRPGYSNVLHIDVHRGQVSWMQHGTPVSTVEASKLLLERVFQPGPVLDR